MADPTPTDQNPDQNPEQKDDQLAKLSQNANKLKAQASATLGAIIKNPIGKKDYIQSQIMNTYGIQIVCVHQGTPSTKIRTLRM